MQRDVTIVVHDGGELSARVRDWVERGTADGWYEESIWIEASEVLEHLDRRTLHHLGAVVLTESGAEKAEFLAVLGRSPWDLVRLLALHVVSGNDTEGTGVASAVDGLRSILYMEVLPVKQQLVTLTVIAPTSGMDGIPNTCLHHGMDGHVVIASEDRVDERYSDLFVSNRNVVGHTGFHLVTIGGLWRGMPYGPLDHLGELHSQDGTPKPILVRGFARQVVVSNAVDKVLHDALDLAGNEWPIPEGCVERISADAVLHDVVESVGSLGNGMFRFGAEPARPRGEIEVVTPFGTLLLFFRYLGDAIRRVPDAIVEKARHRIEELTQRTVTLQTWTPDDDAGRGSGCFGGSTARAIALLRRMGVTPPRLACGDVWRRIRQLCFGLLDGGSLPEGFEEPRWGRTRIILRPGDIVPSPTAGGFCLRAEAGVGLPGVRGPVEIAFCDARRADHLARAIEEAIDQHGTDAVADSPEAKEPNRVAVVLREEMERLRRWRAERESSLLWEVAARTSYELDRAMAALDSAQKSLNTLDRTIDFEPVARSFERMKRGWFVAALIFMLIALAVGGLTLAGALGKGLGVERAMFTWIMGCTAPVLLALLIVPFVVHLRAIRCFRTEVGRCFNDAQWAEEKAVHAAREVLRLSSLYEQLQEWTEVLGWIVHKPWAVTTKVGSEVDEARNAPLGLAAMQVVITPPDPERVRGLGLRARRQITRSGWLGHVWASMSRSAYQTARVRMGLDPEKELPSPEDDDPTAVAVRRIFRDELRVGRLSEIVRYELAEAITQFLSEAVRIEDIVSALHVKDEGLGSVGVHESDLRSFLTLAPEGEVELVGQRELSEDAKVRKRSSVTRVFLALPPGQGRTESTDDMSPQLDEVILPSITVPSGDYVVRSVRLDMSAQLELEDLALSCVSARPAELDQGPATASSGEGDRS